MSPGASATVDAPERGGPPAAAGEVLVVGAGSIGRTHLASLRALEPRRPVRLCRSGHGGPLEPELRALPIEVDLAAALARRPRAVIVANPTAHHLPVALAALAAGCHVLLEKPVAHALEGVADLQALAARASAHVLVGFQFRFHPGLHAIKRWLDEGALGEIVSARAHWGEWLPDWHPGEDYRRGYSARSDLGGGVVLTLCHPFDYLRFLLGEVVAVSAETARRSGLELDVEDTALATLRFASGALASVSLDYVERPPAHTLTLTGRAGVARWDTRDGGARLERAGRAAERVSPPAGFTRQDLFVDQMRHFLACVDGRARPSCPLEDGVAALRIALAAKRAAHEGRRVSLEEVRP